MEAAELCWKFATKPKDGLDIRVIFTNHMFVLREGSVFTRVCLSTGGRGNRNYGWCWLVLLMYSKGSSVF